MARRRRIIRTRHQLPVPPTAEERIEKAKKRVAKAFAKGGVIKRKEFDPDPKPLSLFGMDHAEMILPNRASSILEDPPATQHTSFAGVPIMVNIAVPDGMMIVDPNGGRHMSQATHDEVTRKIAEATDKTFGPARRSYDFRRMR